MKKSSIEYVIINGFTKILLTSSGYDIILNALSSNDKDTAFVQLTSKDTVKGNEYIIRLKSIDLLGSELE